MSICCKKYREFLTVRRYCLLTLLACSVTESSLADPVYSGSPGLDNAPYSEAVVHGSTIYLAGQLGIDPTTGTLVPGGIGPETAQALENLSAALERVGGSMLRVVKCTVFLADISDWSAMNAEYVRFFPNKPARSALGSSGLALNARVEIECIAAK